MAHHALKAKVLDIGIGVGDSPAVLGLEYNLSTLAIRYELEYEREVDIVFDNPRGFRCLDEGDLLSFWKHELFTQNWVFEILEGGWLDREDQQGGFISKAMGYREFMICSVDDCINVLSNEPPRVQAD